MSATTYDARLAAGVRLPTRLRIGTRRSALAMTQTQWLADRVSAQLRAAGHEIEIDLVEVTSHGDVTKASLSSLGGTGVFVTALRDALLEGRVDLAVHSLKDMPTAPFDGLTIAATPPREDPRDVLVARDGLTLAELPRGARIGTGSPRRAAQLRALGLGLEVVDIRGNVDTRLRLVADGVVDGVVLAHAGLLRLGRETEVTQVLDADLMLPAPGQGALAAEARADDAGVLAALATVDDPLTRACVVAERALLARLEAGCAAPVGAWASAGPNTNSNTNKEAGDESPHRIRLQAAVGAVDGSVMLRADAELACPADAAPALADAVALGESLAGDLLIGGAASLIPTDPPAPAREGEP